MDLSLVPINELAEEIDKRCISFICAYYHLEDDKKESKYYYGKGIHSDAVYLASILKNDVINNWNGELRTLQKLNESEE